MIATLTANPAIDKSFFIDALYPDSKLRCSGVTGEPGGGGINVSKALRILGDESVAIFVNGGANGNLLRHLLDENGQNYRAVRIPDFEVRENLTVTDKSTGKQFRFVLPGDRVPPYLHDLFMRQLDRMPESVRFLVMSGSLPEGCSADFYATLIRACKNTNIQCILDTSGEPLRLALREKPLLIKPNLRELSSLHGERLLSADEVPAVTEKMIADGQCELAAVSLGARGAYFASADYSAWIDAPPVQKKSSVGAGDSLVAGIVHSLAKGKSYAEAIRFGVACGSAATMNAGTKLFARADALRLFSRLSAA